MRLLWLWRLTRPDLQFIVTRLATRVTQWSKFEDRQIHRCVAYLNSNQDILLKGSVSHYGDMKLNVFTDADFAGDVHSAKSTSGLWIEVSTNDSYTCPLYWQSKRQGSVARSTTEAELIAMANGLFGEVYNLQEFIQQLCHTELEVTFRQDNNAVLQVLQNGYSAKLRHCGRVHRVNVSSVTEALQDPLFSAEYCTTDSQKANGHTKAVSPTEWSLTLGEYGLKWGLHSL